MIPSLQVYRGLAALLVVLFHLEWIMAKYADTAYTGLWEFGQHGVQFFFVLSGFIIYHAHTRELGQPEFLRIYAWKRLTRIYPPYWIVTLALLPFWLLISGFGLPYHKSFAALIFSLLLWPQPHYPHLEVGWTLVYELLFYALFASLFLSRRFLYLGLLWAAGIILYSARSLSTNYLVDFVFSLNNFLFIAGVFVAISHQKFARSRRLAAAAILTGAALFLLGALLPKFGILWPVLQPIPWYGLASALLVFGCGVPEIEEQFFQSRALLFLGAASYSIYLVNFPLLSFGGKIFRLAQLSSTLPPELIALLLLAAVVAGGCAFHIWVEAPLLVAMKNWTRSRQPAGPSNPAERSLP